MLLILSNTQDATTDYLVAELTKRGKAFVRFDTDSSLRMTRMSYRNGHPSIFIDGISYLPDGFTNVWYRRPEDLKHAGLDTSPEARFIYGEWAEALEGFLAHIPRSKWMNHPALNVGASHKIEQLSTAKALGFTVPDTIVTQSAEDLITFFSEHDGQVIVKPMATGYVERPEGEIDSLVYTNRLSREHLKELNDLSICPTLFQHYIDKDFDVRITVVDDDIHAVSLVARESDGSQRCDIRKNNMDDVSYGRIDLPDDVASGIRALMRHYGLRFAAIDMAVTRDGLWCFFEINPNGQWAWLDEFAGLNIASSFIKVFCD